ncbi:MAG TPA: CHRD domain-containing protein [Vicinamibacterales bacterium]|jgi:hypothetical protein
MRRFAILALGLALFGASACDDNNNNNGPSQQPIVFTAQLRASNEVPPVTGAEANAQGTVTITFNVPRDASGNPSGDGTWNVQAVLSGFASDSVIRLAHIHNGAAGVNAGIFVNTGLTAANQISLTNGGGTVNFTDVPITQAQAAAVVANPAGHYFNMHTALNGGGAVRGQLTRQ